MKISCFETTKTLGYQIVKRGQSKMLKKFNLADFLGIFVLGNAFWLFVYFW